MAYKPRGKYFEEFEVGTEIEGPGRTVTETDIVNFAGVTGDWNQLHTDAEYVKGEMFGERIAHGLLGLSIGVAQLVSLGAVEGTIIAFMGIEWKFKAPVKIGDTIHTIVTVKQKKEMKAAGGGFVVMSMKILNQRDEITQQGDLTMLVKSQAAQAPATESAPSA
jgi:3-hydroxybutyryl-CoA dehydratase